MRKFLLLLSVCGLTACATAPAPDNAVGDYLAGRLAAYTHNVDAAAGAFDGAQDHAPGSLEIRRNAFLFRLAAGDYDAAMTIAEKLASDENADDGGFSRGALAARALKLGHYREAERLAREAGELGFPKAAANILEVWAISGAEGADAGLEKLRAVPGEEFRGFYPLHAGLLSENLGRIDDARSAYQLSLMGFSGAAAAKAFGAFLERHGEESEAREYYDLLASQPGFGRYTGLAGLERIDSGVRAPAFHKVGPAEGGAIALFTIAEGILQDTEQRRSAAQAAGFRVGKADYTIPLAIDRLALYLDPGFADARRLAGAILNAYGDHERAIAEFSAAPASSDIYVLAQIGIANAYRAQEKNDAAIGVLRKLIRREPKALDAQLVLASLFAGEKRYGDAVGILDDVIAALPDDPPQTAWSYYVSRGASLIELDEWGRAEADLKRAVEIAPEEPTALNYLGYSWAERGEHLEEAFKMIEKAVDLAPSSGAIIDSLGWAHYQLGQYEEAVGHLEQAASLEPADPTITEHLGDLYWRLGRALEARYQWRRLLDLDIDDEKADEVKSKIRAGLPAADAN